MDDLDQASLRRFAIKVEFVSAACGIRRVHAAILKEERGS